MTSFRDGDLLLRAWRTSDLSALEALMCDAETMEHTGGALTRDEAREMLERYVARSSDDDIVAVYAVEHDGEVVGSADVLRFEGGALEIGYAIRKSHWRRGLGARSAALILRAAQRLARPGQRIIALVDHGHDASIGVMHRIGMVPAGVHVDPDDGEVLLFAAPAELAAQLSAE